MLMIGRCTFVAVLIVTVVSLVFWTLLPMFDGMPPLYAFLIWQLSAFFRAGINFGNLNALALESLGHMTGPASAFVEPIATFVSFALAAAIGQRFDGMASSLVVGFMVLAGASCIVIDWTNLAQETAKEG